MSYRGPWLASIILVITGCAGTPVATTVPTENATSSSIEPTIVSFTHYRDPLIGMNRAIFGFNDVLYRSALIPAANLYLELIPDPVQSGMARFFANLKTPISTLNFLLQGRFKQSGKSVVRFGVNTTLGLAGIFDPAKSLLELEPDTSNLDATLAQWGAGYGVYLVLPLVGPADLRNSTGRVGDYFLNPLLYLVENPERLIAQSTDGLNGLAPTLVSYKDLSRDIEDPYIYFRNLYLQGVMRDQAYPDDDESTD